MSILLIVGIAFGLSMDALAVSIAAGIFIRQVTGRHVFRLAFHFGLFQALMPIIGWSAGKTFAAAVAAWDHWVAFGILTVIGLKMAGEGVKDEDQHLTKDPSRGVTLLSLSIATSIDALAVGFSFSLLDVSIWLPSAIIGLITGTLSALGVLFGMRIGNRWRRGAALCGGIVLILIGLNLLISHLTAWADGRRGALTPDLDPATALVC